jgi:hypothetical protein
MKRNHACLVIATLAALAAGCTIGNQERRYRTFFNETAAPLVSDYRLPPESEYGPLWALVEGQGWQTRDGSGETKAEMWTSGDFNGDRTVDYAYILIAAASEARALYAFLSTGPGYEAKRLTDGFDEHMGLATRAPGRHETAAARGIGPDSPLNVLEFAVEHAGIDFFQFEGAASCFVWNAATQSFDRYWTSD